MVLEIIRIANEKALLKKNINYIFMYDFRGNLKDKFIDLNHAAKVLNRSAASISKYIKKENRFDGIHFLCRVK